MTKNSFKLVLSWPKENSCLLKGNTLQLLENSRFCLPGFTNFLKPRWALSLCSGSKDPSAKTTTTKIACLQGLLRDHEASKEGLKPSDNELTSNPFPSQRKRNLALSTAVTSRDGRGRNPVCDTDRGRFTACFNEIFSKKEAVQFSWISSANYTLLQSPAKTRKKPTAKSYFNNDHQLRRQDGAVRVATTQVPASTDSLLKHLCHGWHFDFLYCRAGVEPSMKEKERLTIQGGIKQPNIIAVAWGQSQSVFKHFSDVLFK